MKNFIRISVLFALLTPSLGFAQTKPVGVFTNTQKPLSMPEQSSAIAEARKDPTRFQTIKVDDDTAQNEIVFWARQMSEHALFLHLGLEEPKLKAEGLKLHKQFEKFRDKFNEGNVRGKEVLPLAKKLRDYKIRVLALQNTGKWIGWLFPQLVRHITLELDYFVDKLNGVPYTDREEISFWNIINGEHAGFDAHYLDPSERELFEQADDLSQKFENIVESEEEMFLQLSLDSAHELDEYHKKAQQASKNNAIRSVIHPVLLDHVTREGERSIAMLNSLQDTTGAIYPPGMTPSTDVDTEAETNNDADTITQ